MKDILLIIDMQNAYKIGQPWECPKIEAIIRKIKQMLPDTKAQSLPYSIIFTRYLPPSAPKGTWKEYNNVHAEVNADLSLSELIDEFKPYAAHYPVYDKSTYSSCTIPQLQNALEKAERVAVAGVVAQCCVLTTVTGLIDRGLKVIYLSDAVAGQEEDFEEMTEAIVHSFSPIHTDIMTVSDYLATFH